MSAMCLMYGELGSTEAWEPSMNLHVVTVYSMGSALYVLWLLVAGLLVTGLVRNARRGRARLGGAALAWALRDSRRSETVPAN